MESPTFDGFSEPCFYETQALERGIETGCQAVQKELQTFLRSAEFASTVRDIVTERFEVCEHPSAPVTPCCSPAAKESDLGDEQKYAVAYFPSFNARYSDEEE